MSEEWKKTIEKKLSLMPNQACVGFAVRCAKRCQPLYSFLQATSEDISAIASAISTAEQVADGRTNVALINDADVEAARAVFTAMEAAKTHRARGAVFAALSTLSACATVRSIVNGQSPAECAATGADDAWRAAFHVDTSRLLVPLIECDLRTLITQAESGGWTEGTPISQSVFGPMWPESAPKWWC